MECRPWGESSQPPGQPLGWLAGGELSDQFAWKNLTRPSGPYPQRPLLQAAHLNSEHLWHIVLSVYSAKCPSQHPRCLVSLRVP